MIELAKQFLRFSAVGVTAFVIDYGTMVLLTELFGVDYLLSTTIGFIVSVVFNYVASMRFVFTHKQSMSKRREFMVFVVLSVIGLMLNDGLMWLGVDMLGFDYRITKLVAAVLVSVYNFVTRKVFLDAGSTGPDGSQEGGDSA